MTINYENSCLLFINGFPKTTHFLNFWTKSRLGTSFLILVHLLHFENESAHSRELVLPLCLPIPKHTLVFYSSPHTLTFPRSVLWISQPIKGKDCILVPHSWDLSLYSAGAWTITAGEIMPISDSLQTLPAFLVTSSPQLQGHLLCTPTANCSLSLS